ncbi:peptide chain release factor N(5)-glutamine methyltransferase [Candidatus Uhrbacteria bacterium]|nr:peptide chain release factor N(5)-glutamine methyltransferase [Candidatus Uhrbacteria bacterium]
MTITSHLTSVAARLSLADIDSWQLDAELIIAHALGVDRVFLLAHGDEDVATTKAKLIEQFVQKRLRRVPLAYVLGHKEFFGIDFIVNKYTLIPRPETELLVQAVIDYCRAHPYKQSIVELGIGSGCVLLSIVKNCPQLIYVMGIDRVKRAIEVAKENAKTMGLLEKITFKRSDMWQQLTKEFQYDLVVANLPYLSAHELSAARADCPELSYEPQIALLGGTDGLLFFEKLFQRAHRHLRSGAAIFLEIGALQGESVTALAKKYLPTGEVTIMKDDCARDRVIMIQMP